MVIPVPLDKGLLIDAAVLAGPQPDRADVVEGQGVDPQSQGPCGRAALRRDWPRPTRGNLRRVGQLLRGLRVRYDVVKDALVACSRWGHCLWRSQFL